MFDAEFWALDPDVLHLNHGSFGATPRPVSDVQTSWRDRIESNPTRFMEDELAGVLTDAVERVAAFVGADPDGLVFVSNATSGVNAALRSMESELAPGDEVVVTNHGYNACTNAARVTAARTGATVTEVEIPFPVTSSDEIFAAIMDRVTERTRVAVVDHVTSPTALVFPIDRLAAALEPKITVIVDGAHAPGMVPVSIDAIGASFYAGNCHKWMCAPKGSGFLVTRSDRRAVAIPPVISHGWNRAWPGLTRYQAMFGWTGTTDVSSWLAVPAAIDTLDERFGWLELMAANHDLVLRGRSIVEDVLCVDRAVPDELLGAMATIPLPPLDFQANAAPDPTMVALRRHGIEVPVVVSPAGPQRLLRLSAQRYNSEDDYGRLATALQTLVS